MAFGYPFFVGCFMKLVQKNKSDSGGNRTAFLITLLTNLIKTYYTDNDNRAKLFEKLLKNNQFRRKYLVLVICFRIH